jgi:hypothetical protein
MRSCGSAISGTLEAAVAETGKLYVSLLARPRRDGDDT